MTVTKLTAHPHVRPHEPLAYRVNDFCRVIGLSRSKVYQLIGEGRLPTIKLGSIRLIPNHSAKKLIEDATAAADRGPHSLTHKGD